MWRADSFEKPLMLGKIEGRRRRGRQRMRWLDGINLMDLNLSKLWRLVMDRGAWRAAVHRVTKRQTRLSNWAELKHPGDFPREVQRQVSAPHHLMNSGEAAQTGIPGPPVSPGVPPYAPSARLSLSLPALLGSAERVLAVQADTSARWCLFFSGSVVSTSLRLHGPQHARLPYPSPSPGVCSNPCPWSRWCHPTILSSAIPFSSCLQSFPH